MKRKMLLIGIIALSIAILTPLVILHSCKKEPKDNYSFSSQPVVFDFTELSEECFPRGKWSVNRLIEKYGEPKKITANYVSGYEAVYVRIEFENFRINFAHENVERFSFSDSVTSDGDYTLNEVDKNLEMEIMAVSSYDPTTELPYNFKIGQSTKKQILESYPSNASYTLNDNSSSIDLVSYFYAFPDKDGNLPEWNDINSGRIDYLFDENEVLVQVIVNWWMPDN